MDKIKKELYVTFRNQGTECMWFIKQIKKHKDYEFLQLASIAYDYYIILLDIIRRAKRETKQKRSKRKD